MAPYIGEPLNADTVAQMQAGFDYQQEVRQLLAEREAIERQMALHMTNEIDREFISRLAANPVGQLGGQIGSARVDDLIEADFHTGHNGIVYPAIDRLVGSTVMRQTNTPGRAPTVTATIYYHNDAQLQAHLSLDNSGSLLRGMVWYRSQFWAVASIAIASTSTISGDRGYEVTLELLMMDTPPVSPDLTLTTNAEGQTEWVLDANSLINVVTLDPSIHDTGTIINTGLARVDFEVASNDPTTVLKKAKCPICQKRGCVSSHHIPTAAELEQSFAVGADRLTAYALGEADLNEPSEAEAEAMVSAMRAFNNTSLTQMQNRAVDRYGVQQEFTRIQFPEPPILGTVVEQHGDTSYIRLGDNTTIAHNLAIDGAHVAVGTQVTVNNSGHLIPVQSYSPPNP